MVRYIQNRAYHTFFFSLEGLYCILMVSHVLKENIYCITLYCLDVIWYSDPNFPHLNGFLHKVSLCLPCSDHEKNELGSQCLKKMFAFFSLEISGPFIWGDKWDSLRRVQRKGQQGWFKIDFKLCESFSIRNAITPILKGSPAKKKAWAGSGSRAVIHQSERRLFNPWPQQSTCQSVLVLNLKLLPSARSVSVPMNGAPDEWWR